MGGGVAEVVFQGETMDGRALGREVSGEQEMVEEQELKKLQKTNYGCSKTHWFVAAKLFEGLKSASKVVLRIANQLFSKCGAMPIILASPENNEKCKLLSGPCPDLLYQRL